MAKFAEVSQAKVSRLSALARKRGIVRITVADYEPRQREMEARIGERFNLAEVGANLLPHDHHVASLLKRWLLGTHQGAVTADHLDFYPDEFTFRFNRRTSGSRGLLFHRLMQQAMALAPVHGRTIRGGRPLPIPAPPKSKGNEVHT